MPIQYADERDLQRKIAKKLSHGEFSFSQTPSSFFCDLRDSLHNIYVEVKPDEGGAAQLLYGVYKTFGGLGAQNFTPQLLGLATAGEIQFFAVPDYEALRVFATSVDPDFKIAPSAVPHNRNTEALNLLGTPKHINHYDTPLDMESPFVFINEHNIFYIMSRIEKYGMNVRELVSKISDVFINGGDIVILKNGGLTDTVDGSVIQSKKIRVEDQAFIRSLRITPESVETLRSHFDEYERIENRRSLGKFYTKPEVAARASSMILKYVDPDFILEPYAGSGSLVTPFLDYRGLMNDISRDDIEIARMTFEGLAWSADNIDCVTQYSAKELVDRWGLRERWTEKSLIFTNPPFGSSSVSCLTDGGVREGDSRKIPIAYREEQLKYGRGDLMLPSIGQLVEIMKELGQGYLAFFSPLDIFCGRKRYNKLLLQLLSQFTFCEGQILSGSDFNNVSERKPIAFTVWKFGGSTRHLDLRFQYGDQEIGFGEGFFLKDGWKYHECDGDGSIICARHLESFNVPQPPSFHTNPKSGGSQVIPENVKVSLGVEDIPDEIIYSLWSVCVGGGRQEGGIVNSPSYFNGAYTHMPRDFSEKPEQMILVYTLLWNIVNELQRNYTHGLIGFAGVHRLLVFGNPEQSRAVRNLLEKYGDEPCMDSDVRTVLQCLRTRDETGWDRVRELRKDLKTRLASLLDSIGYWDHIVVKPVN